MDLIFRVIVIPGVVFMGMTLAGAPLQACAVGCVVGGLLAVAGCGSSR